MFALSLSLSPSPLLLDDLVQVLSLQTGKLVETLVWFSWPENQGPGVLPLLEGQAFLDWEPLSS